MFSELLRDLRAEKGLSQKKLEPVFTTENAGWARDFFRGPPFGRLSAKSAALRRFTADQGKFSQEYFVYFKKI